MSSTSATTLTAQPALRVEGLRVDLDGRDVNVVKDISFDLMPGELLGLIGESGSGKTTVGSALLGHARVGTRITGGSVTVNGVDLLSLDQAQLRRKRGSVVAYVPQDPTASLNPAMRIGLQLEETLQAHGVHSHQERRERVAAILEEVRLPSDPTFLRRYPHELSGGQQQRIVIANGFICKPAVVVLDEPTTGLDVTTQAHVLRMVHRLCETHRTAGVYVSHDLAVVAGIADRIAVMYYGRLVELGPTEALVKHAAHPYSRGLIQVIPDAQVRRALTSIPGRVTPLDERPPGCSFADRCSFVQPECRIHEIEPVRLTADHVSRCLRVDDVRRLPAVGADLDAPPTVDNPPGQGYFSVSGLTAAYGGKQVLHGIDLDVPRGLVTALVGESGSGKTTLARCVGGLHDEATGAMSVAGMPLKFGARRRTAAERKSVQYIFQNATDALNPRRTVADAIAEPLVTMGGWRPGPELDARVDELLESVALSPRMGQRFPSQLSGGERQRVTIARALATDPDVLVCDEITSALDVSVQASILLLIRRLCAEKDLTLLFVTHNLAVVRAIADRVAVLNLGRIVEEGPVDSVLDTPQDSYTKELLVDTPTINIA